MSMTRWLPYGIARNWDAVVDEFHGHVGFEDPVTTFDGYSINDRCIGKPLDALMTRVDRPDRIRRFMPLRGSSGRVRLYACRLLDVLLPKAYH